MTSPKGGGESGGPGSRRCGDPEEVAPGPGRKTEAAAEQRRRTAALGTRGGVPRRSASSGGGEVSGVCADGSRGKEEARAAAANRARRQRREDRAAVRRERRWPKAEEAGSGSVFISAGRRWRRKKPGSGSKFAGVRDEISESEGEEAGKGNPEIFPH